MNKYETLAKRSEIHLVRRLWHTLCGLVALGLYSVMGIHIYYWGLIALLIAVLGFILDFKRLKNPNLNDSMSRIFRPIMRKSEKDSFSGLPFYALGSAISIFLFEEKIAVLSILFLVFADPIASIVGVYLGKDRLFPNKTLQGTIAASVTCFCITLVYVNYLGQSSSNIFLFSFLAGVVGGISELMSAFNIDDNFTIPVVSGMGLTVFSHLFTVL